MNRLDAVFAAGRRVLVCYLPLGDPLVPADLPARYRAAGVDVLELGIPAADPYLDGPTVTASMARALEAGLTSERAARTIAAYRRALPEHAMVAMTYAEEGDDLVGLAACGVDGVLVPAPARRLPDVGEELERRDVHLLRFLSYEAAAEDVAAARGGRGYVMLQAAPGVTGGERNGLPDRSAAIAALRAAGVEAPIALGVGISTPEQARAAFGMGADAVVVGSATLEAALRGPAALDRFLRSLREAIDER